ncbi:MAG: hypothetical protein H7222_07250 [Methylotenera sp.]|nr:hypothetical protein [Oligoflexia bacterium]
MSYRSTVRLLMRKSVVPVGIILGLCWINASQADDAVRVGPQILEKIDSLELSQDFELIKGGPDATFAIQGTYERPNWHLIVDNHTIELDRKNHFTHEFQARGTADLAVQFLAIGPKGEIERQLIVIPARLWTPKEETHDASSDKRTFISPSVLLTRFRHSETNVSVYESTAVTLKASFNHTLVPERWDLGVTSFFTAFQLSKPSEVQLLKSRTVLTDVSVRYFGLNIRAGYVLPKLVESCRFVIYGGGYYTTMIVSQNQFGFTNLSGPQIYPSLRKSFQKGDTLGAYLKYSPVSNRFVVLNFSNREIAAGLAYTFRDRILNGMPLSASFDYSNIAFGLRGIQVHTTTLSVGASLGL